VRDRHALPSGPAADGPGRSYPERSAGGGVTSTPSVVPARSAGPSRPGRRPRAPAITDRLTQEVPLAEVPALAGHRAPRTTRLYARH